MLRTDEKLLRSLTRSSSLEASNSRHNPLKAEQILHVQRGVPSAVLRPEMERVGVAGGQADVLVRMGVIYSADVMRI